MADEVLKYKVEIDSSDVAEQLQNIRNQVDLAMGSLAAQQVKPTTFDRVSETFTPANIGAVADSFRQKFEKDTNQTLGTMTQMLDRTADRMQLGYGRFTGDLRRIGLLSDPTRPAAGAGLPGQVGLPGSMSFGKGLMASLGLGYDPTSPYTSTDYMLAGGQRISRGFERFTSDYGLTAAGAAIGSIGGIPGAVVGGMIGMGAQVGVDLLTSSAQDVMTYGRGLQELGTGQVRGISPTDGRVEPFYQAQAENLYDWTRSAGGRRMGLSMEELSGQIVDYGGAGGFRGMSPAEFSSTLFQLPAAVRQLSQGANLDQSTAASMIGSMVNMGLADNVLSASTQALTTTNLGGLVGMSPDQIFGAGLSAVTATGGMGIGASDAFRLGTQSTALNAQAVLQGNPDAIALSNRLGGPQQAGFAMLEQGLREMMSPLGLARTANIQGGGREGAGIIESLTGAANFFSESPGNIFSAIANQGQIVGGMNTLTIQNAGVSNAVDLLQGMGFTNDKGQANSDEIIGLMMSLDPSLSRDQAGLAVYNASQGSQPLVSQSVLSARETLIDVNRMNAVSPLNAAWTSVSQPFVNNWDATFGKMGRGLMGGINSFTEGVGDFINEILTGINIERRDPVLNVEVQDIVEGLVTGDSPMINAIWGNRSPVNSRQTNTRLDAEAQSNKYFKGVGEPDFVDSKNGMNLFNRLTYGKSDGDRAKMTEYLNREKRMGRIDNLSIDDVMAFDESMGEFALANASLDPGEQDAAIKIHGVLTNYMGKDEATTNATRKRWRSLSDNDILNEMSGVLGFDSYGDADSASKVGIMRRLMDYRELNDNVGDEGGFVYMNRGFNNLTPTLTESESVQREKVLTARSELDAKMPQIEAKQDEISAAIKTTLTSIGGQKDAEFYNTVKKAFNISGNVDAGTIGDIVSGKRTDLPNVLQVISDLEETGVDSDWEVAMQLRSLVKKGDTYGMRDGIKVGSTTMTYRDAINMNESLALYDDVVEDVNSFITVLDPELAADPTVMETIERIALNERLAGKDKETVRKSLTTKTDKIADYNRRMSITGINEKLKKTIQAEALLDADSLSESIDFQSKFAGLDSAIQSAAEKAIQEEFFIVGARVNKKLENALAGEGEDTHLRVKE